MSEAQKIREKAKLAFVDFVKKEFFDKRELEWFEGGSRRFGYNTTESDSDIFVLLEKANDVAWLHESLIGLGMDFSPNSDYGSGIKFQFSISNVIHISFFLNRTSFDVYIKEHEKVDKLIKKQPYICTVAHKMRSIGYKGSEVYKLLIALATEEK